MCALLSYQASDLALIQLSYSKTYFFALPPHPTGGMTSPSSSHILYRERINASSTYLYTYELLGA